MCPNSFVSFIDWLDSKKGHVMFFVSSLSLLDGPLGFCYILPIYLGIFFYFFLFLRLPFIYILYDLTYQKKEFTLI